MNSVAPPRVAGLLVAGEGMGVFTCLRAALLGFAVDPDEGAIDA